MWFSREFYQLKQEKNEKVQVFSVRLREALNKLTLRFPDRVPAGDDTNPSVIISFME